jgi:hypothetical protein
MVCLLRWDISGLDDRAFRGWSFISGILQLKGHYFASPPSPTLVQDLFEV